MTWHKAAFLAATLLAVVGARAQVAGTQPVSVSVVQSEALLDRWSARKSSLNKSVYNDQNEKLGTVRDLIIAPDGSISAAIISAGGFLNVAVHDIGVPIGSMDVRDGNLYLPGATKAVVVATPTFQCAKVKSPPKPKKQIAD
jgi:hypothetical protein